MADSAPLRWKQVSQKLLTYTMLIITRYAQQIEEELLSLIHGPKPTYESIETLIHKMRTACEQIIFLDFDFAVNVCVGKRLWNAHTLINNRYRKILGRYKGDKKLVVEKRKVEKHYVDFIKTSQFFYKCHIQRLASHFSGIKGLLRVAGKLCLNTVSAEISTNISPELQKLIEQSCHATLLRLGDLSRYRNMLRTKKRSWELAMGYYQLANEIDPLSGMAHNKMAVIALADENHLNAVYHLFRAIAAPRSDTLAPGNLEIEFKKILAARFAPRNDPSTTFIWWFVLLHANFNEGIEFSTHEEMQNEVLSRLISYIKEEHCEKLLEKFVQISIAAQYYSNQRLQDQASQKTPEAIRTFNYHTAFNNRMMFQLLSIIISELDHKPADLEFRGDNDEKLNLMNDKISIVFRRVLPALRHYTLWIASSKELIRSDIGPSHVKMQNKQLWKTYAIALTKIVQYFPVKEMATVPYLLDEDEATIGFMPFRDPKLVKALDFYTKSNGKLKPYIGEHGIMRSNSTIEMQSRILDIVCCGIQLQIDDTVPMKLCNASGSPVFSLVEQSLSPAESPLPTTDDYHIHQKAESPAGDVYNSDDLIDQSPDVDSNDSEAASDSQDSVELSMNLMVDRLVEPSLNWPKSDHDTTLSITEKNNVRKQFKSATSNPLDHRYQNTPKMFPSLPVLYRSAFTPQPNELYPISPFNSTLTRQLSPFSLAPKDDRYSSVSALDDESGYIYVSDLQHRNSLKPILEPKTNSINQNQDQDICLPGFSKFSNQTSTYNSNPIGSIWKRKSSDAQFDPNFYNVNRPDQLSQLHSSVNEKIKNSSKV